MKTHDLKIFSSYFKHVQSGDKTFEIRDNSDRDFQIGDIVNLLEFNPVNDVAGAFTGRSISVKITYITEYMQAFGYAVFSFVLHEG